MTNDDVPEEDTCDEDTDLALGHVADGVDGLADLAEHVVPVGLGRHQLGVADVGIAGRQQYHRMLLEDGPVRGQVVPLHGAEAGHAGHQLGLEEGGNFIDCFQKTLLRLKTLMAVLCGVYLGRDRLEVLQVFLDPAEFLEEMHADHVGQVGRGREKDPRGPHLVQGSQGGQSP